MSRWNLEGTRCSDIAEDIGTRCFSVEQRELLEFNVGTQNITVEDLFNHYYGDNYLTYNKEFTFKAIAIKNKENEFLFHQLKTLTEKLAELINPDNFRELLDVDYKTSNTNTGVDSITHTDTTEENSKADQKNRGVNINRGLMGERSTQISGLEDIDDLKRINLGVDNPEQPVEQQGVQHSNLDYNKHSFDRSSSQQAVGTVSSSTSTTTSKDETKRDSANCGATEQHQVKSVKSREILEATRIKIPEIRVKIMNLYYDLFRGVGLC